ncbi:MAG TPA: hypothetical protein VFJ91_05345 [Gaiellaceae bacterium]|nr:hypothetical protein [Gaiellaceae bacterium]
MSAVADTAFVKERRALRLPAAFVEAASVFGVAYVAYAAVGYRVVVQQHLAVFDAVARLAHAYMVWWNVPPKLASVGFVWPPLQTLAFLPLAAIRPLSTSLAALPLTSAFFAAGTLVVLARTLEIGGLRLPSRLALVGLFAVNPMFLFYATNGQGEAVYLFFLALGTHYLLRWHLGWGARALAVSGLAFGLGILARYELALWTFLAGASIAIALVRRNAPRREIEGTLLAFAAPPVYAVAVWVFANWQIVGAPFGWLAAETPTTQVAGTTTAQPLHHAITALLSLNWRLFLPTLPLLAALVLVALALRDGVSLMLAAALSINAAFTAYLLLRSGNAGFLQLRYNMRPMPLTLAAVAWLLHKSRPRVRPVVLAAALAAFAAAIPLTWRTMETYQYQYDEKPFTEAIAHLGDRNAMTSREYTRALDAATGMADYVRANVHGRNEIFTDDAMTFGTILRSGRPGVFLDRIDTGDKRWLELLAKPWGAFDYMLVSNNEVDLILRYYPFVLNGATPGLTPVYRTAGEVLVRVAPHPPEGSRNH